MRTISASSGRPSRRAVPASASSSSPAAASAARARGQLARPPRLRDPLARFDAAVGEPSATDGQARRRREPLQDLLGHQPR